MKRHWVTTESTYLEIIKRNRKALDAYGCGYDAALGFREEGILKDSDAVGLPVDEMGRIPISAARERFGSEFCKDKPSIFDKEEEKKDPPRKNNQGHGKKLFTVATSNTGSFDLFSDLPIKPLATNNYTRDGLHKVSRTDVFKGMYKEWQFNPENCYSYIVLDADYNFMDWWIWNNEGKPVPNVVVTNPDTMKSHLYFKLSCPVHNNSNSSKKAKYMYNRLRKELTVLFAADPNYVNKTAHCPFSSNYITETLNSKPYTMKELRAYTKGVVVKDKIRQGMCVDSSRNCALFNMARIWAYTAVVKYKSFPAFYDAVASYIEAHNGSEEIFSITGKRIPLNFSEIKSIISSVSEYVWSHRGRYISRRTPEAANSCRVKGLFTRNKNTERLQRRFLSLYKQGKPFTVIADTLGVTRQTLHRWFVVIRCLLHETKQRVHTRVSEMQHALYIACAEVLGSDITGEKLLSSGYFDSGG